MFLTISNSTLSTLPPQQKEVDSRRHGCSSTNQSNNPFFVLRCGKHPLSTDRERKSRHNKGNLTSSNHHDRCTSTQPKRLCIESAGRCNKTTFLHAQIERLVQKQYKDSTTPPTLPKKSSMFALLREPSLQLLNRYGTQEDGSCCCCCIQ